MNVYIHFSMSTMFICMGINTYVHIYSGHCPGTHPLASHFPAQWEHLTCPTTSQGGPGLINKGTKAGSLWLKVEPTVRCNSCSSTP